MELELPEKKLEKKLVLMQEVVVKVLVQVRKQMGLLQ
jgi:hypothetical protein